MIKEIEVGGVKHSITLADDMVGTGLGKGGNGAVYIKVMELSSPEHDLMSGIVFDTGNRMCLQKSSIAYSLAGTGLYYEGGQICFSASGMARDLASSGLFADYGSLVVNISTGSGLSFNDSGIQAPQRGIGIKIARRASGLRLFFTSSGALDVTQD